MIVVRLSQAEYARHVVSDWEEMTGRTVRRASAPCQQSPAPRAEELPLRECGTGRRKIIGELIYAARCTRPDISFAVSRLGRYVERWCEWAEADLGHICGYLAERADLSLVLLNAGDSWDSLRVDIWCDADFSAPKTSFC